MNIQLQCECLSGEALYIYDGEARIITAGDIVTPVVLSDVPDDVQGNELITWLTDHQDAWSAVGFGAARASAGQIRVTSPDQTLLVREFGEVYCFDPRGSDYCDHILGPGREVTLNTVLSSVLTVQVLGIYHQM